MSALGRCQTVDDVRALARRRVPRPIFDYVDGGAEEERSLAINRAAWAGFSFQPRVLRDVGAVDPSMTLLGAALALPLVLAPTGYNRMMNPGGGELAVCRAAAAARLPHTLSTVASTSIEELAAGAPDAIRWFQLYAWRDRGFVEELIDRAWESGCRVLALAVDVPVAGLRLRDVRNGLAIPPRPTAATIARVAARPRYWWQLVRRPPAGLANAPRGGAPMTVAEISGQFDPAVDWRRLEQIRERWPGELLVKGPLGSDDAVRAVAAGADGVWLSNHGGRQLDRIAAPVTVLPAVRAALGPEPVVIVDSGITSGADLAVAAALGADAGAVGKAYLYGLMAGGQSGVTRVLELLDSGLRRTMALLGAPDVATLRAEGAELVIARR